MAAGELLARRLRRGLIGPILVIGAVAGAAGGLATGLLDGADRTRTSAERLIRESRLLDVMVTDPSLTLEQTEQIRAIPGVRGASLLSGLALFPDNGQFLNLTTSLDGRWGTDLDVARIVRGRAVDPAAHDEMVLGEAAARALGVDVGDEVRFNSWTPEQVAEWDQGEPSSAEEEFAFRGPTIDFRLVGISRHPADLSSDDPLAFFTALPDSFWRDYEGRVGEYGFRFVAVDLGDDPSPSDEATVAEAVAEIVGPNAGFEDAGAQAGGPMMTTLDFVASALVALAVAVAVGGLVVVVLLVARTVARVTEQTAILSALGMTDRERARTTTVTLAPSAVAAGLVTVAVAVATSMFMPFGLARRADPDPGLHLDGAVLGLGAAATVAVVVALIAMASTRSGRRSGTEHRVRPMATPRRVTRNLPVGAVCGLDLALGSGGAAGRGANRAAIGGVALAAVAGVGALVLGASVDHLFATPATFGWTWDYAVDAEAAELLVENPDVESLGLVTAAPITLNGRPVMTRGLTSLKGELPLLIVRGRPPEPGEIVLGARTMDDLGVGLGDTVVASGAQDERELRVVGQAVFAGVVDGPEAGWGSGMPLDQFTELGPEGETFSAAVLSVADGVDAGAFGQRLADELGIAPNAVEEPVELARLREIEAFPWVLTGFLVAVGLVATAHAVLTTTRRRRGDLAVLRSMGLARRDVYQAISVQAGALALIGAAIGAPLGVVAGGALWRGLATTLGVVVTVEVPWAAIFLATVAACVVLALLALVPARRVARTPPAHALRAE